jgi:hypothetical protein
VPSAGQGPDPQALDTLCRRRPVCAVYTIAYLEAVARGRQLLAGSVRSPVCHKAAFRQYPKPFQWIDGKQTLLRGTEALLSALNSMGDHHGICS